MIDVGKPPEIAYVVEYVDVDGHSRVTAYAVPLDASRAVERVLAHGGHVVSKRVERGADAAALLRAVASTSDDASEVF